MMVQDVQIKERKKGSGEKTPPRLIVPTTPLTVARSG